MPDSKDVMRASVLHPDRSISLQNVTPAGRVVLVGMGAHALPMPVPAIQNRELTVTGVFRYTNTWPLAARLAARAGGPRRSCHRRSTH